MDLDIIFKIVAIGIITAIAGMLLKKANKDDLATIVSMIGLVLALVMLIDVLAELYETLSTIFTVSLWI